MALFGMKEPDWDYEGIWKAYSAIEQRMQKDYEDELSAARADLAKRGIKEGSDGWNAAIQTIEEKRKATTGELANTEAAQILKRGYTQFAGFALSPLLTAEYGDPSQQANYGMFKPGIERIYGKGAYNEMISLLAGNEGQKFDMSKWKRKAVSMNEFYEGQFGRPTMAAPAEQPMEGVENAAANAAQQRAKRASAGGFSPWW